MHVRSAGHGIMSFRNIDDANQIYKYIWLVHQEVTAYLAVKYSMRTKSNEIIVACVTVVS